MSFDDPHGLYVMLPAPVRAAVRAARAEPGWRGGSLYYGRLDVVLGEACGAGVALTLAGFVADRGPRGWRWTWWAR